MRMKRKVIPLSLIFSAVLSSMIVLTASVFADSKHITFNEPVTVGSIVLAPGVYKVAWVGTGPDVLVTFMKGGKTVATTPARLVLEKSPYHARAIETMTMPDNSRVLKRLSFSDRALVFDLSNSAGESQEPIAA
jgi:hypothetical protein